MPVPGGNPTGQVFNSARKRLPGRRLEGSRPLFIVDTRLDRLEAVARRDRGLERRRQVRRRGQPHRRARAARPPRARCSRDWPWPPRPRQAPNCSPRTWPTPGSTSSTRTSRLLTTPKRVQGPEDPGGLRPVRNPELSAARSTSPTASRTRPRPTWSPAPASASSTSTTSTAGSSSTCPRTAPLNEPWGLAIAPKGFGPFAGDLLVGNLGNGWINVFNPTTGKYLGSLDGPSGTRSRSPACGGSGWAIPRSADRRRWYSAPARTPTPTAWSACSTPPGESPAAARGAGAPAPRPRPPPGRPHAGLAARSCS